MYTNGIFSDRCGFDEDEIKYDDMVKKWSIKQISKKKHYIFKNVKASPYK